MKIILRIPQNKENVLLSIKLFEYLESNPIIDIKKTAAELGIAFNTVSGIVKEFCTAGILKQTSTQSRNRTFAYREYLDILKAGT